MPNSPSCTLIVMTAWCGYFFASRKAGVPWLSFGLVHALLGIGPLLHAAFAGVLLTVGGSSYLGAFANPLTGWLTFLTSVVYLGAYTPLKRFSPLLNFVGA